MSITQSACSKVGLAEGFNRSMFKERVLCRAIRDGYIAEESPVASFVDQDAVARTISDLHSAFPKHYQHAFAAKANSMSSALKLVKAHGLGCEVASRGELEQALRVGFTGAEIVYDEPAKTRSVIEQVLAGGICLNIDNFQEYELISSIMQDKGSESAIGFRINPQVGAGSIGAMSTATATSKFGIALGDDGNRAMLIKCYKENPWLTSIHTHIGSQGCTLDLMIKGIRKVVDLAEEIDSTAGNQQIRIIDIGGGLPVNFDSEEVSPTFAEYASRLADKVPELFSGKFIVKTEFGRSIYAKNGFIAARVEYTKTAGGRRIAISHAGAQIATRTTFMPELWKLRLSVFDSSGREKAGDLVTQDIAGPCCFSGDMIGYERRLPLIEPGDYIMLHDTGAYYFSNPYFYNSLPAPAVYAATSVDGDTVILDTWRTQQSLDDMHTVIG